MQVHVLIDSVSNLKRVVASMTTSEHVNSALKFRVSEVCLLYIKDTYFFETLIPVANILKT
jgi:hypothetical protein